MEHSIIQKFFLMHLGIREKKWKIRPFPNLLLQVAEGETRRCDICVMARDQPLGEKMAPPLLCVEVLLPTDGMSDVHERVEEYIRMGVKMVWIADPRRRRVFQTDGASPAQVQVLTIPSTEILIGIDEVFAELDGLLLWQPE